MRRWSTLVVSLGTAMGCATCPPAPSSTRSEPTGEASPSTPVSAEREPSQEPSEATAPTECDPFGSYFLVTRRVGGDCPPNHMIGSGHRLSIARQEDGSVRWATSHFVWEQGALEAPCEASFGPAEFTLWGGNQFSADMNIRFTSLGFSGHLRMRSVSEESCDVVFAVAGIEYEEAARFTPEAEIAPPAPPASPE